MANILARILDVPAALIMRLQEPYIEVLVSSESEGNPYKPGDKEKVWGSGLYCETVINTRDKLHVPDALSDRHWKNNPDVKLQMIAYLGFPISLPDGTPFGTLCVLDNKRNDHSELTEQLMLQFRAMMEAHLEVAYMNHRLGEKNKRLADYLMELQALRGIVPICSHCKSIKSPEGKWRPIEAYLIQHPEADFSHGICPDCMRTLYPNY